MKPFILTLCLAGAASPVLAAPITLQNATASFSQASFPVTETIDGDLGGTGDTNGWAINPDIFEQNAVYETQADVGGVAGASFTFTLTQNFGGQHTLGRFRFWATTDDRSLFADGGQTGGDVTANWVQLTPLTALATNGATLNIQGDNSILASGTSPAESVYTITAATPLTGITGLRLQVLEDPSLPSQGPGRQPSNGNFVLQELQVDAINVVPEPGSAGLIGAAGVALLMLRGRR